MLFLLFFYKLVQTFPFQSVFCGVLELLVQGVVWHPLHLFCMNEKFGLSPALKGFNFSSLLHFSYGSGFHGTKCDVEYNQHQLLSSLSAFHTIHQQKRYQAVVFNGGCGYSDFERCMSKINLLTRIDC